MISRSLLPSAWLRIAHRFFLAAGLCFLAAMAAVPAAAANRDHPNLILMISDDQDYEHFGFAGHPIARTPTIDRLAREGTLFPIAHVPMSRCHPTLASLLSGRYPHQSGIYYNYGERPLDVPDSLPRLLSDAGYATYCEGKYWEGKPERLGFTHGPGRNSNRFVRKDQQQLFAFIDQVGDQPFFVWWAPRMPHTPHNPPPRLVRTVPPDPIPIPGYIRHDFRQAFVKKEQLSFAMETWLDEGVADLLDELHRTGHDRDTLIVFLIDNGWCNGLVSKGSPREKGVRTPLFFYGPGLVPAHQRIDGLFTTIDVPPTLLDFAGLRVPATYAGRSLKRVLESGHGGGREILFGAAYPAFATPGANRPERDLYALYARSQRWKYVVYFQDVREDRNRTYFRIQYIGTDFPAHDRGDQELFDLAADPYEQKNLAGLDAQRSRCNTFRRQVLDWWQATGGRPLADPVAGRVGAAGKP